MCEMNPWEKEIFYIMLPSGELRAPEVTWGQGWFNLDRVCCCLKYKLYFPFFYDFSSCVGSWLRDNGCKTSVGSGQEEANKC